MNVKELIEQLQLYPLDMPVMIRGYEGGYSDVNGLMPLELKLNVNDPETYYYGPHDIESLPNIVKVHDPIRYALAKHTPLTNTVVLK